MERVADQWTMLILEVLEEHGVVRFTRLGELVGGISQKMLTQTLRQMEADGLVKRTVHPVIPPKVEYELTKLGRSLGAAFCGVWVWAETHRAEIERARAAHAERSGAAAKSKHLTANVSERRLAAARLAVREPTGSRATPQRRGKA